MINQRRGQRRPTNETLMPDPKLKLAMEEIKAVLNKHDIAGMCFLASPSHTEFLIKLDATWTCFIHEGGLLRLRALAKDFPNPAEHKKVIEKSLGVALGFMRTMEHTNQTLAAMVIQASESVGKISHWDRQEN